MSKVKIIKGDLFSAPVGSVLAHSCNGQGVWGAGVAKLFADHFPAARGIYQRHCAKHGKAVMGTCLLIEAGNYKVACLFTSFNYGYLKDPPDLILKNTNSSMQDLLHQIGPDELICMPKINSGLFNVPWDDTQVVLESFDRPIIVYEL